MPLPKVTGSFDGFDKFELVNTILEETIHPILLPPPEFSRKHESHLAPLAVLARTCRMFQDPALDLLWRSQKSLYPLLSCLPSDAWDLHEDSELKSTTRMRLLRPLTASDWSRVLVYSPRIKCLTLILGSQSRTYSFWVSIRTSIPGPFLLPNLQRLSHTERIHHLQLPDPPILQDFLGPQLTFLSLGAFSEDLVGLPDLIPLLPNPIGIKIKVRTQQPSSCTPDTEKISRFVSALNVTSLEVPELDSAAMRHISSLPSLRFLALTLRELVLGRDQCASAAELMSFLKAQSWQLDSLEFACTPNSANVQDLRDHCSHPTLKRLHLSLGRNLYVPMATDNFDQADIVRCTVLFNVVQVLFSFPNLTHLALTSAIGIDLDNAAVLQMALAWPHLESLSLKPERYHPQQPPSRLTIQSLLAFAQNCFHLQALDITLGAIDVPPGLNIAAVAPQRQLTALDVCHSPISSHNINDFAENVLPPIFPNLQKLSGENWTYQY